MTGKKYLALTFDDGPSASVTPLVLDALKSFGINATFFLIGGNIAGNEEIVRRAFLDGNEIENHSKTHPAFPALSKEQMLSEIDFTSEIIERITGRAPRFFRPPYIALSGETFETVPLTFIEGIGCEDWVDEVSAATRAERIISAASAGDVILLHDMEGNFKTAEAIKTIIPKLLSQGFEFVTVSKLFKLYGVTPQKGTIYTNVLTAKPWQG